MTAPADMGAKGTASDGPDDAVSQDYFDREPTADRFHNRAPHSPESLAESLSDVRDSLEWRFGGRRGEAWPPNWPARWRASEQRAAANARRLAAGSGGHGRAPWPRRVRALEHRAPAPETPRAPPAEAGPPRHRPARQAGPAAPARPRTWRSVFALAAILAAVLSGFWVLASERFDARRAAARARQATRDSAAHIGDAPGRDHSAARRALRRDPTRQTRLDQTSLERGQPPPLAAGGGDGIGLAEPCPPANPDWLRAYHGPN